MINMKRVYTLMIAACFVGAAVAQEETEDDGNLVPNYSFETLSKKIKELGAIHVAEPWKSATLAPADVYSAKCKKGPAVAGRNHIGEEDALTGGNYAGFRAYSYKDKTPRSYVYVELKEPLKAGKTYCVTFNVSFADLSKYAVNNLGAYLSEEPLTAKNTGILEAKAHVMQRTNRIFEKQFYWEAICGTFKAKGGEKYLTIGNFRPTVDTKYKKVKKPRGFTSPQVYDGYYYLDDVFVKEDVPGTCVCEKNPGGRTTIEKRTFESDPDDQPMSLKKIHNYTIYFDEGKAALKDVYNVDLEKAAATLIDSKETSIKVIGYIDGSETEVDQLGDRRATNVAKYLESKGVPATRIEATSMGTDDPADSSGTSTGKKKNMRVKIVVEGM